MKTNILLLFTSITLILSSLVVVSLAQDKSGASAAAYHFTAPELDRALGVRSDAPRQANFVRLVYFHRVPGCQTCQKMSQYVFQTVEEKFAAETADKRLVLRYIDFENPKYAAQVRAFKIGSPTLIAIEVRNGRDARFWNLDQIWPLSGRKEAFNAYVEAELRRIMNSVEKSTRSPGREE